MMNTSIPGITLNDGLTVPSIGFGTAALKGSDGAHAFKSAIDLGYRLIDSAYNYENEGAVGRAVKRSPIPREELFISSKLAGRCPRYYNGGPTIQESLYRAEW